MRRCGSFATWGERSLGEAAVVQFPAPPRFLGTRMRRIGTSRPGDPAGFHTAAEITNLAAPVRKRLAIMAPRKNPGGERPPPRTTHAMVAMPQPNEIEAPLIARRHDQRRHSESCAVRSMAWIPRTAAQGMKASLSRRETKNAAPTPLASTFTLVEIISEQKAKTIFPRLCLGTRTPDTSVSIKTQSTFRSRSNNWNRAARSAASAGSATHPRGEISRDGQGCV